MILNIGPKSMRRVSIC